VQERIMRGTSDKFIFKCTDEAKHFLLTEGIDFKYGARHLKRAIERFLVYPLSNLIATSQVGMGDLLTVDYSPEIGKLVFAKEAGGALVPGDIDPNGYQDHHAQTRGSGALMIAEAGPAPARAKE
jgi:ATP-dependent Clp protease ATP-binding subunit ClpB